MALTKKNAFEITKESAYLKEVHSLDEAKTWFLEHSSGSVICVKGDTKQEVFSYPEAEKFYGN